MRQTIILLILWYLRFWARLALWIHKPKVIGITGSVGKSSCRDIIYSALKDYVSVKVIEKGNSETGIPLGILGLEVINNSFIDWLRMLLLSPFGLLFLRNTKYLIIEMGVDEPYSPKNMEYLLTIVNPYIAIFLNVYPVHSMQFDVTVPAAVTGKKRIDEVTKRIATEKGKILTMSKASIGIYNQDNSYIKHLVSQMNNERITLFSFGKEKTNNIYYDDYKLTTQGTTYYFYVLIHRSGHKIKVNLKNYLLPEVYREIIAAAILVGISLKIPENLLVQSIEQNFSLPAGRASIFKGINNSIIIDSSYNASRSAVLAFLHMLDELKKQTKQPVVFVFGDMRELGKEAEIEHEEVAAKIPGIVDYLYCIGPLTKQYILPKVEGKIKESLWFPDAKTVGEYLKNNLPKNALVLVKGSQNTIFLEETVKIILLKKSDEKKLCRQSEFWMRKKLHSPSPGKK